MTTFSETTAPVMIFTLPSGHPIGDVEAPGTLTVTDAGGATQRLVVWGVEDNADYAFTDSTGTGGLYYEAESRTLFAGVLNPSPGNTSGTSRVGSATGATDTFNLAAHGFAANSRVTFGDFDVTGTSLSSLTSYFVSATGLTADAFKVSLTSGGAVVDVTSDVASLRIYPGSTSVRAATVDAYLPVLSTQSAAGAHLTHVGAFRFIARILGGTNSNLTVALDWSIDGFSSFTRNDAIELELVQPTVEGQWMLVDLGIVTIPPGTTNWEGRIVARATDPVMSITVDYFFLVPVKRGGQVTAADRSETVTRMTAYDDFTQSFAGALVGQSLIVGGTWGGAIGDPDDWTVDSTNDWVTRTVVSDTSRRFLFPSASSASQAAVAVQATMWHSAAVSSASNGIVARWVDLTHYIAADVSSGVGPTYRVNVLSAGIGTPANVFSIPTVIFPPSPVVVRLVVFPDGWFIVYAGTSEAALTPFMISWAGALATGGAVATGIPGITDYQAAAGAVTRFLTGFKAWTFPHDVAIFPSRSVRITSQKVERQDSTGTTWQGVGQYAGDRLLIPPTTRRARQVRFLVKTSRGTLIVPGVKYGAWDAGKNVAETTLTPADDMQATVSYTPRGLSVPKPS